MATFICDCRYSITQSKVKFTSNSGNLIPDNPPICPICKTVMTLELYSTTIGEVSFTPNKFDSLNELGKKEMIHKRAKKHYERFAKADVERKRNETISNIKQKFEEGTKL